MPSLYGEDDGIGYGVFGVSNTNTGVLGESNNGYGVRGSSDTLLGVYGRSNTNTGVVGQTYGRSVAGVAGYGDSDSYGVFGESRYYYAGVFGRSTYGPGVEGYSRGGGYGVYGHSYMGYGVVGETGGSDVAGVFGSSESSPGVVGNSGSNYGLYAFSLSGTGVYGSSGSGLAAFLDGNVRITGNLTITGTLQKGGGSFKIDHPLDPANKYLSHSFVESPDMKNVYDGVVTLDDKGEAEIELPDWFGALNKDFRYQLTAIGSPGPNLYISEEIPDATTRNYSRTRSSNSNKNKNNNSSRFRLAGGASRMKVSWQVTGIRKDPWANAHRIPVEEDKPANERGYYTYPELYGQPEERGISHLLFPTDEEEKKELLLINNQNKLTT
jgi:hypothetical protein